MAPPEIRAARQQLGLTLSEMGRMLDVSRRDVSPYEAPEGAATHCKPPARVVRLLRAYLGGHRPDDWPTR